MCLFTSTLCWDKSAFKSVLDLLVAFYLKFRFGWRAWNKEYKLSCQRVLSLILFQLFYSWFSKPTMLQEQSPEPFLKTSKSLSCTLISTWIIPEIRQKTFSCNHFYWLCKSQLKVNESVDGKISSCRKKEDLNEGKQLP